MHRALEDPGRVSLVLAKQGGQSLGGSRLSEGTSMVSSNPSPLFLHTSTFFSSRGASKTTGVSRLST